MVYNGFMEPYKDDCIRLHLVKAVILLHFNTPVAVDAAFRARPN